MKQCTFIAIFAPILLLPLSVMPVLHDVHAVTAAATMGDYFLYHRPMTTRHFSVSHYQLSFARRAIKMPGRLEGMSDAEWELFKNIFLKKAWKGREMPATHPHKILNLLLFIVVTGCRWCDLPRGEKWASKSVSHRWLKAWHSDGSLKELQALLLGYAQNERLIC